MYTNESNRPGALRCSLEVRKLNGGLALVVRDHPLIGPLVRAMAPQVFGHVERLANRHCELCGLTARQTGILSVGPTTPPCRQLTTRCSHCRERPPAQDQSLAYLADSRVLTPSVLANMKAQMEAFVAEEDAAAEADREWFDAHPFRQFRERPPVTSGEHASAGVHVAAMTDYFAAVGMRVEPTVVIARDAAPHLRPVALALPLGFIDNLVARPCPATLQSGDLLRDCVLAVIYEASQADMAQVFGDDELHRMAVASAQARLTGASVMPAKTGKSKGDTE